MLLRGQQLPEADVRASQAERDGGRVEQRVGALEEVGRGGVVPPLEGRVPVYRELTGRGLVALGDLSKGDAGASALARSSAEKQP